MKTEGLSKGFLFRHLVLAGFGLEWEVETDDGRVVAGGSSQYDPTVNGPHLHLSNNEYVQQ
jgi:hypothetical protein